LLLQLGHNPRTASVAEAVQEQWKELGVNVELRQVDFPQHLSQVRAGELPMWRTSWIGDYPDPENFLALFTSANKAPGGPNTTHLVSSRLDSLYTEALNPTFSSEQRYSLYAQMQQEIVEQSPWIFLYHDVLIRLTQPNIQGLTIDGTGRLLLERVKKQIPRRESKATEIPNP
jgi:peptide/nickel transport system substrate-binding protein